MIDEDLPVAGELTDEEIAVATVQEVLVLMKILTTQMNRLKKPSTKDIRQALCILILCTAEEGSTLNSFYKIEHEVQTGTIQTEITNYFDHV